MFHPDTQFLIDHWTGLARATGVRGGIPARSALAPEAFGRRLARTFIVDRRDEGAVLTLAGTALEALWRAPLAGTPLTALWTPESTDLVEQALTRAVREARPLVVSAFTTGEPSMALEMVVAPMRSVSGRTDRLIGLFAPAPALAPVRGTPPRLVARLVVNAGVPGRPALSLAVNEGRRIA